MTPSNIELYARHRLNAVGSKFWTSAEIIEDYLYDACLEIAMKTFCIQNRYTASSVASQQEYTKPTYAMAILRVDYNGSKLKPISFRELDSIDLNTSTTTTGTPQYYYDFDNVFGLFPVPDTSSLTITVHTYDEPAAITVNSTLQIPTRYHGFLVTGVAYRMARKELGHPMIAEFGSRWLSELERIKETERAIKNKDGFNVVLMEENLPNTILGAP